MRLRNFQIPTGCNEEINLKVVGHAQELGYRRSPSIETLKKANVISLGHMDEDCRDPSIEWNEKIFPEETDGKIITPAQFFDLSELDVVVSQFEIDDTGVPDEDSVYEGRYEDGQTLETLEESLEAIVSGELILDEDGYYFFLGDDRVMAKSRNSDRKYDEYDPNSISLPCSVVKKDKVVRHQYIFKVLNRDRYDITSHMSEEEFDFYYGNSSSKDYEIFPKSRVENWF